MVLDPGELVEEFDDLPVVEIHGPGSVGRVTALGGRVLLYGHFAGGAGPAVTA
jgi:hypothetical protein